MSLLLSCLFILTGVPVVSNTTTQDAFSVEFHRDLSFGGGEESDDEYLWMDKLKPTTFEIGNNGYFYILEASNSRLLEFDDKGVYIREFATRGEGPGEFQNMSNFQILKDGSAIGMDQLAGSRKATYYDKNLKFVKAVNVGGLDRIAVSPYFSPDGSLFYSMVVQVKLMEGKAPQNTFMTAIMNDHFNFVKKFDGQLWPAFDPQKVNDKEYWADFIGKQFDILINKITKAATFLSTGEVLIFDAKKYEIQMWSPDLKTHLRTVTKNYTPTLYSEDEKSALAESLEETIFNQGLQKYVDDHVLQNAIERANLPLKMNPIAGIVPMEEGKFFVVTRVDMRNGHVSGDFFDRQGVYMGKMDIPGQGLFELNTPMNASIRLMFKNGYAYAMQRNEDGDNEMVRYTYKIQKK